MIRESYETANHANYPRATCRDCHIPCNPHTREYRALEVCEKCYGDVPPLKLVKKGGSHGAVAKRTDQ